MEYINWICYPITWGWKTSCWIYRNGPLYYFYGLNFERKEGENGSGEKIKNARKMWKSKANLTWEWIEVCLVVRRGYE